VPALSTESFAKEFDVSPEQMQMLAHENDALVKEYSDMRDAITNTQTSMNDIVRLQTTLQDQLLYQATQIDRLYDEATDTLETVRKANTHLNQAGGRQSTSVRFFLWFILLAAIFVLLLHVISD
jgi:t-SNARE complex subunit (syntaxin)